MNYFTEFPARAAEALLAAVLAGACAHAGSITSSSIVAIPKAVTEAAPSGNGSLDLRMFTFSGSGISNVSGAFNGDNANNALPQGGGADTGFFAESYVTTAGDLKAFYNLNFPSGSIHNMLLFLDLNETGAGELFNTLDKLEIVLNPTTIQGNPNPSGDVSSLGQAAIKQVYTGGTLLASLSPQPAKNLPVNSQGAGFADYAIFTDTDPFGFQDNDVLLFNVSMSQLNNGAEEIFLGGRYSPGDVVAAVPEPSATLLVALLALPRVVMGFRGYLRKKRWVR